MNSLLKHGVCIVKIWLNYSLEDGRASLADVSTGSETETADKAGAQVTQDITVQVGHDEDVELARVLHHLQANGVQVHLLEFDVRVLFGYLACTLQEEAVRESHDVGLVHHGDLVALVECGVLERELGDTSGGLFGDQLDTLNDAIDNLEYILV